MLPSGRSRFHQQVVAIRAEADGAQGRAWLGVPRLWVIVVLGGIGVMQLAATPSAIDLAYHVKAGELVVGQRAVLRSDVLSWATGGGPWLDQTGEPSCCCTRPGAPAGSRW